jgi:hypothetical protein
VTSVTQDGRTGAVARLRARLLEAQQGDGGWGAAPGRRPNTESTAFAALALAGVTPAAREASARGVGWLIARQRADGSWPFTDQSPQGAWSTAPAVLALARLGGSDPAVQRGAAWLAGRKGLHWTSPKPGWRDRLARIVGASEPPQRRPDMDTSIPGWPWLDGTFSWVEPTSLAMLALRAAGRGPTTSPQLVQRLDDGRRLLIDRATKDAGWNYGNGRALDYDLEPFPDTTAWALLALRGAPGVAPLAERGLATLGRMMQENRSGLARALAALAFSAYGRDDGPVRAALAAQCAESSTDPRLTDARSQALALLALAGLTQPLTD